MSVNQIPVAHPSFSVIVGSGQSTNGTAAQNATAAAGGGAAFVVTANVIPGVYSGSSSNVSGISCGASVNPIANDQAAFGVTSKQTSFIVYAKSAWTARTTPDSTANQAQSIAGNSTIFAYSGYETNAASNYVKTSTDGIAWTSRTTFGVTCSPQISVANNIFIYGAPGTTDIIRTSTDGITWTTRAVYGIASTNANGCFAAYGNSTYVVAGYNGGINTSTNAITWVTRQLNANPLTAVRSLTYGPAGFLAQGTALVYAVSTDGITWSTRSWATDIAGTNPRGVAVSSTNYLVFTSAPSSGKSKVYTSTNFTTWSYISDAPFVVSGNQNINWYINNLYIANAGSSFAVSTDGITWATKNAGTNPYFVTYGNSRYMQGASDNSSLFTSSDISGTVTNTAVVNLVGTRPTAIF